MNLTEAYVQKNLTVQLLVKEDIWPVSRGCSMLDFDS